MSTEERLTRFRQAMASFPTGVTIVTTVDAGGRWWGFTATSFCSLSLRPPLVLVCLATSARCHPIFSTADSWVVHIIPMHHEGLALRFACKEADKFGRGEFLANPRGHPVLAGACAVVECNTFARYDGGDHTILVGEVTESHVHDDQPAVYFRRQFRTLSPYDLADNRTIVTYP